MPAQRVTRELHLLRGGINRVAFGGEREALRHPVEHTKLKIFLEPLDATEHIGRAGAQSGCGLAKTQSARRDNEHAQIVPRNALEQRSPNGVFRFCSYPLRKFCHRSEHPLAMLLYGGRV